MHKSKVICILLAVLILLSAQAALAETPFKIGLFPLESESVRQLQSAHPELLLSSDVPPNTTDTLIQALLTGTFDYDVFPIVTSICDMSTIIQKGYLADLSAFDDVQASVEAMNPAVRQQVMKDGHIYGVPSVIHINYLSYDPDTWASVGFDGQEVPDTFEEFLDLLEKWIAYVRETNNREVCVYGNFDASLYQESTYPRWLTELLVENTIMQQTYAGEALCFDTPDFLQLLERCQRIGKQLHEVEGAPSEDGGRMPLVVSNGLELTNLRYFLCLRLNEQQPKLLSAELWVTAVSADSEQASVGAEFAIRQLEANRRDTNLTELLFNDPQPVENPDFRPTVERIRSKLENLQAQLNDAENLSAEARLKLQNQLERCQQDLAAASAPERAWWLSEAELEVFRSFGEHIYFQRPGVFAIGTEYGNMLAQLMDRYATGTIAAKQFVQRLDEIAWMAEMEASQS